MKNKLNGTPAVYAPSYYMDFKCIADRCRHSCCIDWEICIDSEAYEKYKKIKGIINTVNASDDGPCFALEDDGRCPHLNCDGLCSIILSYGEEYLSEICRKHPRFYNFISGKRTEAGLGIVCEEACRMILENEAPFSLVKTEEIADGCGVDGCGDTEDCFDALSERNRIISVIEKSEMSYDEKLRVLKNEYNIPEPYTPDEWLDVFLSLEILDSEWKGELSSMRGKLFSVNGENTDKYGKYYERLLTYFVYRHVSTAENETELSARLAFAILSVDVIRSLFEEEIKKAPPLFKRDGAPEKLIDFARRYSAEIEYSEENTAELIFEFESELL